MERSEKLVKTSADSHTSHTCSICKQTFSANYSLRKHVQKFHSNYNVDLLAPKLSPYRNYVGNYKFFCDQCPRQFNHSRYLTSHQKNEHNIVNSIEIEKGKKCPLCTFKNQFKKELILHFKLEHDVEIKTQYLEFDNLEKCLNWISLTEKTTNSKYVKECGSSTSKDHLVSRFVCHRSGNFVSEGNGFRHLKTQGTNKIGAFCPAGIKLTEDLNSHRCKIEYTDVHVGHENDLGHLFLTFSERETLAAKIAAKIPFNVILDEVRDSITDSSLERLHLLTKKDLYNLEDRFNLHSEAVRHKCDTISIESWVNEMHNNGCVLFYKAQGTESPEYPHLKIEDFILIIMNDGQKEILKKYGSDAICIDSTHGTNGYDCELTTLLILDDLRQGFPCSFLISNRGDKTVVSIFFAFVKEHVGNLSPKVFMSDMAETFYNSWLEIMSPAQFR